MASWGMSDRFTDTPSSFTEEELGEELFGDALGGGLRERLGEPRDIDDGHVGDTGAEDDYEIKRAFEESFVT